MSVLSIHDLHASIGDKEILKGVSLTLESGKINALMGPNGSGKSTLAHVLMGHPGYKVTSGSIILDGEDITSLAPDERAQRGIFLSFQYPKEVPGVTISSFLRTALASIRKSPVAVHEFMKLLEQKMMILGMDKKFLSRYLNEGFSGGEKKRAEILQMLVLDPKIAILDETDSGLDIDALRIVASGVNSYMKSEKCVLIITHYKRILEYVKPHKLFIMIDGRIKLEGTGELVDKLEEKGYGWIEED